MAVQEFIPPIAPKEAGQGKVHAAYEHSRTHGVAAAELVPQGGRH